MTVEAGDLVLLEARTRALLASGRVTEPTRRALLGRLDRRFDAVTTLSDTQMRTLEAACLRLIPEPALVARIGLARAFEAGLREGLGRGWRRAVAPPDLALHRAGLDALDTHGLRRHASAFADLAASQQDALLQAAADGALDPPGDVDPAIWFVELATALSEIFYAHPLVQVSIGYDGMADAAPPLAVGLQAVAEEASCHGG